MAKAEKKHVISLPRQLQVLRPFLPYFLIHLLQQMLSNRGLFLDCLAPELFLLDLEMNEPCEDIQEAVPLPYFFPEIGGLVLSYAGPASNPPY